VGIYKRKAGGPWYVKFSSGGEIVRRSSGSTDRAFAEEYETTLRNAYLRKAKLKKGVHTWRDATKRYLKEADWRPATRATNEYALSFFERIDILPVDEIDAEVARHARDFVERRQSRASANRIMAVFRGVLRKCVDWEWLYKMPKIRFDRIEQKTIEPLTAEEYMRLEAQLPDHLKGPARFSVLTGLREANVSGLKWSQVDLERGWLIVPGSQYKTKRDYATTLTTAAIAVLAAQPRVSAFVFTFDGKRVTRFNNHAFRKARARAGLPHVRWHDLRHTFASWMAQSGASDRVLQQAGGWSSTKMVERYAHLRPSDMLPHLLAVSSKLDTGSADDVS
jgi:integrase